MEKTIDFDLVSDLYDSYVNVDFDISFYKKFCEGYESILELMCGTGRISLPLIMAGYNLTCVDYSEGMLDVFRSKLPKGFNTEIFCQDICELNLQKQFDLVMIPFNSISEITDKEKRQRAFQNIYNHLEPGGVFFCTLYNPEYRKKIADGNLKCLGKFDIGDHRNLMVTYYNHYSIGDELITGMQFYEIYGKDHKLIEKRAMDIRFAIVSNEEITEMAKATGFLLQEIYGDYSFSPFSDKSMFMNCVFYKL
ncbi:class I SAM-dependent methyltransferase [Fusibacter ferrireducens]|uniref:Class I SAM-dependent methyltransferase n=1 Tax=Fusibacter ferrireducens TaxID=2785058 RepID=A0ABR9ZPH2_9FIRM|nr:class I SAM-dependent methyltransferase [Fusibacter ferrireducens]MBF4691519.1 class I SAM-dependent methyltransferase [Fusibacter ferrireducens]